MSKTYRLRDIFTNQTEEVEYHRISKLLVAAKRLVLDEESKIAISGEEFENHKILVRTSAFLLGLIESISIENQGFSMDVLDDLASIKDELHDIRLQLARLKQK